MGSAVGAPQLRYMRALPCMNDYEIPAAAFFTIDLALELQLQAAKGRSFRGREQFFLHHSHTGAGRRCARRVSGMQPQERICALVRSSRWINTSRPHSQRHAQVSPNQWLTTFIWPT